MKRPLDDIGGLLRRDMGEARDASRHAAERARFIERVTSDKPRRIPLLLGFATAALLAVLLVLWVRVERPNSDLGFVVGSEELRGELGAYYSAPPQGDLALHFDDGSRIVLKDGGGIRVSKATRTEAVVWVERGTMRFDVEHEPERQWRVAAGPYAIRVTGTAFTVEWQRTSNELAVQMHEGRVRVSGPGLEGGVELAGNQRFVSRTTASVASSTALESPPPPSDEPKRDEANELPATSAPDHMETLTKTSSSAQGHTSWSRWVASGDHDRVLAEADAKGVPDVLRTADSEDLRALADAARFRGRSALAREALLALRTRFPGSARATSAAFVLGRLEDDRGQPAPALEWYEAYLAEGGPLAPEARGRRMMALHQLGRMAEAERRAREYLQEHPGGPYAEAARDIVR